MPDQVHVPRTRRDGIECQAKTGLGCGIPHAPELRARMWSYDCGDFLNTSDTGGGLPEVPPTMDFNPVPLVQSLVAALRLLFALVEFSICPSQILVVGRHHAVTYFWGMPRPVTR